MFNISKSLKVITYVAISTGAVHVLKSALGMNFLFMGVSIVILEGKKINFLEKGGGEGHTVIWPKPWHPLANHHWVEPNHKQDDEQQI